MTPREEVFGDSVLTDSYFSCTSDRRPRLGTVSASRCDAVREYDSCMQVLASTKLAQQILYGGVDYVKSFFGGERLLGRWPKMVLEKQTTFFLFFFLLKKRRRREGGRIPERSTKNGSN